MKNNISFSLILICILFCKKNIQAQAPELIIPATHVAGAVVIAPNDAWLASAGADGIKIWDNKNNRLIKNLQLGSKSISRFNDGVVTMAINPASTLLAMQIEDSLHFFDFENFTFLPAIAVKSKITAMVFANDSKSIFTGGYTKDDNGVYYFIEKIALQNKSTPVIVQQLKEENFASHDIDKLTISNNGNDLLVYDAVMGSWIIDINTNAIKKHFKLAQNYFPHSYLPNGNLLAVSGKKEKLMYLVELDNKNYLPLRKTKSLFKNIDGYNAAEECKILSNQKNAALLYFDYKAIFFNTVDFTVSTPKYFKQVLPQVYTNKNIALTSTGNHYVLAQNMGKYNITNTENAVTTYGEFPLDSYVQFVYKNINAVCLKDRILTFDNGIFTQRIIKPLIKDDNGFLYRITNDGKTGFIYSQEWGLYRFNPTVANIEYEAINKINGMYKKFVGMQIFETANVFTLIGNEGIYVMDLKTLKLLYIVDIPYGLHYNFFERLDRFCDISPDNTKMILFARAKDEEDDFICMVDLADRNEKWKYKSKNIQNLRYTNNGSKIAFTTDNNLMYLDANTGVQVGNTISLPSSNYETILSPSGTKAATKVDMSANNNIGFNIGLVDITNNKTIGTIQGTGDDVTGFVFLKNERYLLTEEYGGLCIWDVTQQRKVAKIYLFENSPEWVIITADGRFDATEGALKKMYFTKGKEIIPLESLFEKYYVPGLLKQLWDNNVPYVNVPNINEVKSPPTIKIGIQAKERNLVVEDDTKPVNLNTEQAIIKIDADGITDVIAEVRLFQNGKLVESTRNLTVEDEIKGDKIVSKSFTVLLNKGENTFRAIALNSQRTESLPAIINANYIPPVDVVVKPQAVEVQLHILVVGINAYKNPKYILNYAVADATAFNSALTEGAQNLFTKINTIFIKDADATKEKIEAAFTSIKMAAHPQDLFVFYYAGHGVINDKKQFYLVPYDVIQLYGNDGALAQKGFSAAMLGQMSKEIKAQKQLFILDACQSAGAVENITGARGAAEEKAIAQLARSTGTQWLTASGSEQFASEFSQLGHGSFTYCLLQAFKGDTNPADKKLTVRQLDAYLQTKVPEVTQKYKGTPQYPTSYSYGNDFPIIIIK